jgi:MoxR-like ATPase
MNSERIFQPERVQRCTTVGGRQPSGAGDARDGGVYVYHDEEIALAVNVAWATGRPLLLSGPSGSGKSSLALNVAFTLGWRYYEHVITSRTEARDLLYTFDSIRRLNDAQATRQLENTAAYVQPGVLWWAFDRDGAARRGDPNLPPHLHASDKTAVADSARAVVLIDEIDKADVDVPNNLLVPLGSLQFKVEQTGAEVVAVHPPLIFITTNGERELPLTFIRRCVSLTLPRLNEQRLIEIARSKIPETQHDLEMFGVVARLVLHQAEDEGQGGWVPSTAEYLDTVRACINLDIKPADPTFEKMTRITLRKRQNLQGTEA